MGKRLCDVEPPRGRESKRESKREHLFLLRKYDREDKLEDGMPPAAAGGGGDKGTLITARIAQAGSVATG